MSWVPEIMGLPPEIDLRRGLHIKLLPDTRNEFRICCLRRGLSMQEVFEELAQRIVTDDPTLKQIMDELVQRKRQKEFRKMSPTDAESIFDQIELESPLSKK